MLVQLFQKGDIMDKNFKTFLLGYTAIIVIIYIPILLMVYFAIFNYYAYKTLSINNYLITHRDEQNESIIH